MVAENIGSPFDRLLLELPDDQKSPILTAVVLAGSVLVPRLSAIELRLSALESGQERIEGALAEILQEIKST